MNEEMREDNDNDDDDEEEHPNRQCVRYSHKVGSS